jgi:hypothetical protein
MAYHNFSIVTRHVHGCVTTGDVWRFLVLQGSRATIETTTLDIRDDLDRIPGILRAMSFDQITLAD